MRKIRRRALAAVSACAVAAAAGGVLGVPGTAQAAPESVLPGSLAPAVTPRASLGPVPATEKLTVQVWLKPDLSGATAFANAVASPGSTKFHHYLSPDAYTARFGPSAAQAGAVESWLAAQGLTQVHADRGRDYVSVTGPASKIQSAFQVRLNRYRVTGSNGRPTVILSNDREVSVPASLAPSVLAVTGLNSTQPATFDVAGAHAPEPAAAPTCSHYWAQHVSSFRPAFRGLTKGTLPICGYSADQLRGAYGATMASTGKGQTIALIEDGTPTAMFTTLTDYARSNHLPAPAPSRFRELRIGRSSGCGNPFDGEEQLDSEAAYAMAPGATQLMVDGGCGMRLQGVQSLFNAELAVLTGNGTSASASIESNSWGITGGEAYPVIYAKTAHAIDLRAAAEGVGMYFASGDSPGVSVPASDPYSLAVGGTTLGIGASNTTVFETGWSNDDGFRHKGKWTDEGIGRDASGGGASLLYAQPAYQKGVVPASMSHVHAGGRIATDRTVPDISADADFDNSGILMGIIERTRTGQPGKYHTMENGGTSLACPLVAGLIADAQQGQPSGFGFINPLIYQLAGTRAFRDVLPVTAATPQKDRDAYHPGSKYFGPSVDVLDSQLYAYTNQVTAKGYDTMTGVGTPNGAAFLAGLRRAAR